MNPGRAHNSAIEIRLTAGRSLLAEPGLDPSHLRAASAAIARTSVDGPVTVKTVAGALEFRTESEILRMVSSVEIIASGEFCFAD
ncbi:hypothetical protein [uncultured Paludibaculum sp.]|uniref:hypothetical protein n=1 Tax=uncultured Paludibaculum sp. TaxID=1765020 RepID=UPI002AABB2E3|nr:hypothetical protein [uncultured Paludibaculum sp.]